MSRIRIRCRVPPREGGDAHFSGFERVASLCDTDVYVIASDGTETPMLNVESVRFVVEGNEPARAIVTFFQPEIDVEAVLDAAEPTS